MMGEEPDAEMPCALYVLSPDAKRKPYPHTHLSRMLWSYDRSFQVEWAVSYGWPVFDMSALGDGASRFVVAFVEEGALSAEHWKQGICADDLLANELVWVAKAHDPARNVPVRGEVGVLQRPLSYERFCQACAKLMFPQVQPYAGRYEYHTIDVLQDIWCEYVPPQKHAPVPRARYSLDDVLDASRTEALVITRRNRPFTLLHANKAFWEKVRWSPDSCVGKNLSFLQGEGTQKAALEQLHKKLDSEAMRERSQGEWADTLVNYTERGEPFHNRLHVTPCTDASLYVGVVSVTERAEPPPLAADTQPVLDALSAAAGGDGSGSGDGPSGTRATDEAFASSLEAVLLDRTSNVVVTKAEPPFAIVHVNDAWCELCDMTREEVVGKQSLNCIQGPLTDPGIVRESMERLISKKEPVEMRLTNYKKGGRPFMNRVVVEPIADASGTPRYFVGRLHEEPIQPGDPALPEPMSVD